MAAGVSFAAASHARSTNRRMLLLGDVPVHTSDAVSRGLNSLLVAAHVVVGGLVVFVATWNLGIADAAPDEYSYRHCANAYLNGIFTCNQEHPYLAKEFLSIGLSAGSNSIYSARLVTALFAIATAVFCYLFVTDCSDRFGGLIAAFAWGVLPQAGIEGHTTLEAIRIDRFALLDPFVACFVAMALFASWRWIHRGGLVWAGCTGLACAAATCAKAPGVLIVPVIAVVVIVHRRKDLILVGELTCAIAAGFVVILASFAPAGLGNAVHEISYMFNYQTGRGSTGNVVLVDGHVYTHTPFWADASFAIVGLSLSAAITLAIAALVGIFFYRGPALYTLAIGISIVLGVSLILHLSLPHYWIDWEPCLIVAASLGLRACCARRVALPAACVGFAFLGIAATRTVHAIASVKPGPYQLAGTAVTCSTACIVQYTGFSNTMINYVGSDVELVIGPPRTRQGMIETSALRAGKRVWFVPTFVVIDPDVLRIHGTWRSYVHNFAAIAHKDDFRRLSVPGRIQVWANTATMHSP